MENTIKLLSQLIKTPSVYPDEHRMGGYIKSLFKKTKYRPIEQRVEKNRSNIIVEKGSGSKTVLLYSHLDTVPAADGWKKNPLKPYRDGDRLFGLGAFDMKAGMAVNIMTFFQFEPKNIKLKLLFCVDEEHISKGAYVFAQSSHMKDLVCVLSPEPAFKYGVNGIVTGRIGRSVIKINLSFPSRHFYYYDQKNDIGLLAADIITGLKKLYKTQGDKKEFAYVSGLQSRAVGMSTPQQISIELNLSVLPPSNNIQMLSRIKNIVNKAKKNYNPDIIRNTYFMERETPFLSGYELPKSDPYLYLMKKSIQKITGKKAIPYFRSSVADENIFGFSGKSVFGVGPVGGNAHGADEWVSIKSLVMLQEIYLHFLKCIDH